MRAGLNPIFHTFGFFFALLAAAAAAVSCRLCHTVPQTLKLSTLWQPRYNTTVAPKKKKKKEQSHNNFVRTTTYYACVDIAYACVLCVL